MSWKPLVSNARRIRRCTLGIVIAMLLLVAAFGIGGHTLLQVYSALAAHNAPIACGSIMQPCVPFRL